MQNLLLVNLGSPCAALAQQPTAAATACSPSALHKIPLSASRLQRFLETAPAWALTRLYQLAHAYAQALTMPHLGYPAQSSPELVGCMRVCPLRQFVGRAGMLRVMLLPNV
eukprot:1027204-Pelagomonas_calceolata.AAC.3